MVSFERPAGWKADNPKGAHAYNARLKNGINVYNSFSGDNYQPSQPTAYAAATPTASTPSPAPVAPTEAKKGLFGDTGQQIADAIGVTGDGSKENPTKLWGMEIDGEDGILSDLETLTKAFGDDSSMPVPQVIQPRTGQSKQNPIKFASSVYQGFGGDDEELKKRRRTGLFDKGLFYG